MSVRPEWARQYAEERERAEIAMESYRRAVSAMAHTLAVTRCQYGFPGGECSLDYGHAGAHRNRKEDYPDNWEFK